MRDPPLKKHYIPKEPKNVHYFKRHDERTEAKDITLLKDYISKVIMNCEQWKIPGLAVTVVKGINITTNLLIM